MKKFFKNISFLAIVASMAFLNFACSEEEAPAPIVEENNPKGKVQVTYAVSVVSASNKAGRVAGIDAAQVTITTQAGTMTKTTGADGMVVFNGVYPGTVSGHITKAGYTEINFTANVDPEVTTITSDSSLSYYAASTVTVFETNGAIEGRLFGDFDLDDTPPYDVFNPDPTDGGNLIEQDLKVKYSITPSYPMGTGLGMLTSVTLGTSIYQDNTTFGSGAFDIDNLPNTETGYIEATMSMVPYLATDESTVDSYGYVFKNLYQFVNNGGSTPLNPTDPIMIPAGASAQLGDVIVVY